MKRHLLVLFIFTMVMIIMVLIMYVSGLTNEQQTVRPVKVEYIPAPQGVLT